MIFALIDCNNFYASCETLFRPALHGRPVVVLSNNDGCVVARSAETKALGIKMGTPWHMLKDLARRHGIIAFSSNYALYADMSARVMRLLATYSPLQEVYSIDECFLNLSGAQPTPRDCARLIRNEVHRQVGLPVCVGLGTTKTLAKLANHVAKKRPQYDGVFTFDGLSEREVESIMASIEVGEVWGIGSRFASRLNAMGIRSVLDLKQSPAKVLRRQFSVTLERTIRELNGEVSYELMAGPNERQQIFSSRSFGKLIGDLAPLEESIVSYATRATEKLRAQKLLTGCVAVMIRTNPFRADLPQYQRSVALPITSTDDTRLIVQDALKILRLIYRDGYLYQMTGVLLSELTLREQRQGGLFDDPLAQEKSEALMQAMDRVNRIFGRGTLKLLAEGSDDAPWKMRAERRSPRYTTRLEEVPLVATGRRGHREA